MSRIQSIMTSANLPNQIGFVTNASITRLNNPISITAFGDLQQSFMHSASIFDANISLRINDPGAFMQTFNRWISGGMNGPSFQHEFLCLYCGTPNEITQTNCAKCGAPRSFVIG